MQFLYIIYISGLLHLLDKLTIDNFAHRFSWRKRERLVVCGFGACIAPTVRVGRSHIILIKCNSFWHHACFRSLLEHIFTASLMSKGAQISHLWAILCGRPILTKCGHSLRILVCPAMHHVISNLLNLFINLFVVLLGLLLESSLFN